MGRVSIKSHCLSKHSESLFCNAIANAQWERSISVHMRCRILLAIDCVAFEKIHFQKKARRKVLNHKLKTRFYLLSKE